VRFSRLLVPTTKETPNDAVLASHIFLLRGGFIQSVGGSGLYNFLPLGKRVLDRVRSVVKEELDSAGCQEVSLSFVTPAALWQESGRFEKYGKELLRFKDRKENDFVLGPTHEEMMVNLVRQSVKSYKQLPLNLYQINLKFRDEIRPRFGLMRGREFLMKDGYSFHASEEDMRRKIFTRLGLAFRVVEADSGAIGGSGSKEFMVLAESGEDTIVVCDSCEYGANIEAAVIEALSAFFHVDPYYLVKTVAKRALYDEGKSDIVLFALRGSDELQEVKACNAVNANDLADVTEEELAEAGLPAGYMGPVNVPEGVRVVCDNNLKEAVSMICGANEEAYHLVGVNLKEKAPEAVYADLAAVQEGDLCSCCGAPLRYTKGIEAGHIFQLGTRYSEPLGCTFLDENGKAQPMVMGTYGIGVSRLLAAIIEQHHDEKGCVWTKESAPFALYIMVSNIKDDAQLALGEKLYAAAQEAGIDVLFDDRKDRFGAKMKDYELIGIPHAVIIGKKLAEGKVEFVTREGMQKEEVAAETIIETVKEKLC